MPLKASLVILYKTQSSSTFIVAALGVLYSKANSPKNCPYLYSN